MGSLESARSLKREHNHRLLLRSQSSVAGRGQRLKSIIKRILFFNKIDYLQWICAAGVFFFFVVVFQMFLPGSMLEKPENISIHSEIRSGDLELLKELGGLDFGEDVELEPFNLEKLKRGNMELNGTVGTRRVLNFEYTKPKLGLVFANLLVDRYQVMMLHVALALREIGYDIEVLTLEDGPAYGVWRDVQIPVNVIQSNESLMLYVDWLNYNGLFLNSLEAAAVLPCLMQEPFKNVPVIWTFHEHALAARLRHYNSSGQTVLVDNWRKVFSRVNFVVFPNYILPMHYSMVDAGNYYVMLGSATEAWEADKLMPSNKDSLRAKMEYLPEDFVIAIVGSQLLYKGLWLEHALVLQALLPVLQELQKDENWNSHFKIIVLTGPSNSNYSVAVETIALTLKYPKGMVKLVAQDEDEDIILRISDIVIYSSLHEEISFPDILLKAMCFGKPIVAPDLAIMKKHIEDGVNGFLFPKENIKVLTQIITRLVSNGKLSLLAQNSALFGQRTARDLMISESVEGYALLMETILGFPSQVENSLLKAEWQGQLFEAIDSNQSQNQTWRTHKSLDVLEKRLFHTQRVDPMAAAMRIDESFVYSIWEEEKFTQMASRRKQREDEELKGRTDQLRGTWEEVYKNAKRVDRAKNDLHERDDEELGRTGQPLCIYEPYYGEGAWPFLHHTSLYRGIGLSTKGRRPGIDDIDGPSCLPLLNNSYYRDVLSEHGGFFAIANRTDRIHKNAWIGFQSWRATARKEALSKTAETSLVNAIEAQTYGDALFFWVHMDLKLLTKPPKRDFWSFCDLMNAGNCQFVFSEALKKMYGMKQNLTSLPPMPVDGGTWSAMHCWVLPTRSFLEFVMFSRMFVDALDSLFYDEHFQSGHCYLSLTRDKHCYSRVLELLVNVWAYHSGRRMVYVDSKTGLIQEQHELKRRRGHMWVKWFQHETLKSLDEELAESADTDPPKRRWLWPETGEVFWEGILDKERSLRIKEKESRKQQNRDKILRMRKRARQKSLGKYVKPTQEDTDSSNSTLAAAAKLTL